MVKNNGLTISKLKKRFTQGNWLRFAGIVGSLIVVSLVFSLLTPAFLKERNLINIALQAAINAVIALGMTLVIITGGIDLSAPVTGAGLLRAFRHKKTL